MGKERASKAVTLLADPAHANNLVPRFQSGSPYLTPYNPD